jgi:hypothetical protein
MPVPDGAGRMRMETGAPLCSPTPLHSTAERIVSSWVKNESEMISVNAVGYAKVTKICLWQKSHSPWCAEVAERPSGHRGR